MNSLKNQTDPQKINNNDRRVDINILLNRVRGEKKRERTENLLFLSLIASVIIVTGIIASL